VKSVSLVGQLHKCKLAGRILWGIDILYPIDPSALPFIDDVLDDIEPTGKETVERTLQKRDVRIEGCAARH